MYKIPPKYTQNSNAVHCYIEIDHNFGFIHVHQDQNTLNYQKGKILLHTLEYRQSLTSIKKIGVNSPKIDPTQSKSKFPRKCRNRDSVKIAHFQEL